MGKKAFKIHENSRKAQHVFWLRAATKMEGVVEGIRNWVPTTKCYGKQPVPQRKN
jgi:hypothetical protein